MKAILGAKLSRSRNTRLAALIAQANWRNAQLARAVNTQSCQRGLSTRYDDTAVAHWLAGTLPRPATRDLILIVLSTRLRRVITDTDAGFPPRRAATANSGRDPVTNLILASRAVLGLEEAPTRRIVSYRTFLDVTTTEPRPVLQGSDVLKEITASFALMDGTHSPAHVRAALAGYIAFSAVPAPGTVQTAGYARLAHLMATMSYNAGHEADSQIFFRAAIELSSASGDQMLNAIILRALSAQAQATGDTAAALDLAQTSLEHASIAVPGLRAYVHVQLALVHAAQGHDRQAVTDLTHAEKEFSQQTGSGQGLFESYPRAGLEYQRARIFTTLGEPSRAAQAFRASLAHRPADQRRRRAHTHAALAQLLAENGHVDDACTHTALFLELLPAVRAAQSEAAARRLHAALAVVPNHYRATALRRQLANHCGSAL
ncbi:hypothetical protein SAMN05216371_0130 [Streptomyces sp. TLI_053]|uniref:hypothetical protein n=1 Tax=Streptomyces sp. TLI_053 TaxID=1855352 RepID=UPI00087ADAF0|nr:hypothetical protein [Streptomyces sp. TLI_053]SDS54368.1 hypothetical protein SAMN05216371_0130 [Streptomyces sp. TLI_053]